MSILIYILVPFDMGGIEWADVERIAPKVPAILRRAFSILGGYKDVEVSELHHILWTYNRVFDMVLFLLQCHPDVDSLYVSN